MPLPQWSGGMMRSMSYFSLGKMVCRAVSHFYKVKDGSYCFFDVRGWALLLYNFLKFAYSFLRLCGMHLLTVVHNYAIIIAQ